MSVSDFLSKVALHKEYNAFIQIDEIDLNKRFENICDGPLKGELVAVKDNICVEGLNLTCASKMLDGFKVPYSATVIQKLEKAGAIIAGKTNLDEFAMGSSNEFSYFGPAFNSVDKSRVAGGSSGGSTVAVGCGLVDYALGSDTGGSVRQPASFNGVVGLKPSYGRVSRYGLVAFASSFDQIGPITKTVEQSAKILGVIAGHDPLDATSMDVPVPDYVANLKRPASEFTIGIPKEYFGEGIQPEVEEAVRKTIINMETAGAKIIEVSLPHTEYGIAVYYIISSAEASSNLARYDGVRYGFRGSDESMDEMFRQTRAKGFGSEVKRRIMLGTYVLSSGYYDSFYGQAQKVRRIIKEDYLNVFKKVDAIITPTTPTTAFKSGEKLTDPMAMYLNDIYTVSANLVGIPAMSLPVGNDKNGLPIGCQIMAPSFKEETIFQLGTLIEGFQK
jgi:aspartyl-tRNA(Asn)/glutamyl-tRNA(Gln) amidotransferase subunit A